MSDEEKPTRGFTVVDRRASAQGEDETPPAPDANETAQPAASENAGAPASDVSAAPQPAASPAPSASASAPAGAQNEPAQAAASVASEGAAAAAADAEEPAAPTVDFSSLVISFGSSALYHLGLVPDPQTQQPGEKNLPHARQAIDTLALLQQKTQGNLDAAETKLLGDVLKELRMRFVEANRG